MSSPTPHTDRQRSLPKQMEMFSQRDIAQFGVKANPHIPLSGNVKLLLIPEDPRTPEEVERDLQRAAERNTYPITDRVRVLGEEIGL